MIAFIPSHSWPFDGNCNFVCACKNEPQAIIIIARVRAHLNVPVSLSYYLQCSWGATRVWSLLILSSRWGERWSSWGRSWSSWSISKRYSGELLHSSGGQTSAGYGWVGHHCSGCIASSFIHSFSIPPCPALRGLAGVFGQVASLSQGLSCFVLGENSVDGMFWTVVQKSFCSINLKSCIVCFCFSFPRALRAGWKLCFPRTLGRH